MPEHSKEYMWLFHSPGGNTTHPIFLYEYLGGRSGSVIQDYLVGYEGTLITDGYQPYHTLMKNNNTIKVAGCWEHARRKFAEIIKSVSKGAVLTLAQKAAAEAVKRIDAVYWSGLANVFWSDEYGADVPFDTEFTAKLPTERNYFMNAIETTRMKI